MVSKEFADRRSNGAGELELTEEELVKTYPRLWHMAHDGAWPAIWDHGLMSAEAILEPMA